MFINSDFNFFTSILNDQGVLLNKGLSLSDLSCSASIIVKFWNGHITNSDLYLQSIIKTTTSFILMKALTVLAVLVKKYGLPFKKFIRMRFIIFLLGLGHPSTCYKGASLFGIISPYISPMVSFHSRW